ncbi:hypothetical protein ACHAWF_011839 [Thalassiosira exigua]
MTMMVNAELEGRRIRRRRRRRRRAGKESTLTSPRLNSPLALALLLAASAPFPSGAYLGPTHCVKPGATALSAVHHASRGGASRGYSTFNHLLFDLTSLASSFKSGHILPEERLTFRICPGTVLDLDDTSLPLGFLPIEVPRLTLQCGDRGRREDDCVVRGGGKRDPGYGGWNANPSRAYKEGAAGILGGGRGSVAQVYVYGDSAYEVTLRGLTFDNTPTEGEERLYRQYVAEFGEPAEDDPNMFAADEGDIEEEYEESVPSFEEEYDSKFQGGQAQEQAEDNRGNELRGLEEDGGVKPAHRFAAVAVRGKGYGDDAGPRLVTIEDCRFVRHRGYAVLVSPGIERPEMPKAPAFDLSKNSPSAPAMDGGSAPANPESSGQIYHSGNNNNDINNQDVNVNGNGSGNSNNVNGNNRKLNLLNDIYIPQDGHVSYFDDTPNANYLDGRRVKISGTEFVSNVVEGDNVAGLVTSAYSLTLTDCLFQDNRAKSMVFVYNDEALVDGTVFAKNAVEVSTVIMASPLGSKSSSAATDGDRPAPTHIVERSCFLGSKVGMSNVLVTDADKAGFGQRDNYATGTEFAWVSECEGGAAEKAGNDCLEARGGCDGTCVEFTSARCQAEGANGREYEMLLNGAGRITSNWDLSDLLGFTPILAMSAGFVLF